MLDPIARVEDDKGVLYVDLNASGVVVGVELHVKPAARVYLKVERRGTVMLEGFYTEGVHRYDIPGNRRWTYDDVVETGFGYTLGTA